MINPVQLAITQPDGTLRRIIIEPVLHKTGEELHGTSVYKIYKDAFGDETELFTEPLESEEQASALPDESNPDYLGKISGVELTYEGEVLSEDEQAEVKAYIKGFGNSN
jgi:hypothetical protein